jgi:hypothetical protein
MGESYPLDNTRPDFPGPSNLSLIAEFANHDDRAITVDAQIGLFYSVYNAAPSPVPETATMEMLLAGLTAVGALVTTRAKRQPS